MNKNNFRFFGITALLVVVLLIVLVLALATPTDVTFEGNITNNYDKEGVFTVNWTITGDTALSQLVYYKLDGGGYVTAVNNSATGYSFSNTTEGNYTFIVEAENTTNSVKTNASLVWMIVDTTDPVVDYATGALADNAASNTLTSIFVNISVTEANNHSLVFSLYNSTSLVSQVVYLTNATLGINFTGLPVNVAYTYNVTVNDSATNSVTTDTRTFTLDNVKPVVSLTKTSGGQTSLELSISGVDGTCTADRSGATISGSTLTEIGLSCGNSYTYIVTCTDSAGNAGSSSATSFSTTGCSSGGSSTPKPKKASYSFSKITPGVAVILKNFDAEIGVKEIKIEVNNPAQSVIIIITKSDGKPAAVSVEKSGKVYKYLQIDTTNLADNFGKATMTLQVGKSWLSSNGLDTDEVALFKFDENSEKWNELATTYTGSEGNNELYEVELTSFSFFAIGEKSAVEVDGEEATGEKAAKEKSNLVWLWVAIILVVLVIYVAMNRKKYSNLFFKKQ